MSVSLHRKKVLAVLVSLYSLKNLFEFFSKNEGNREISLIFCLYLQREQF